MIMKNPNNFPANCHVCATDFLARYNVGAKAKVCTPREHKCSKSLSEKGKVISCEEKCCRSRYLAGVSSQASVSIQKTRLLSHQEFTDVMSATYKLRPPIGLTIRFVGATGCRISEALLVRRENLFCDREGSTIQIPSVKREGRPMRSVDLTDEILLAELMAKKKQRECGLFFLAKKRTVQYNFSKILKRLGIVKSTGIHILRHTRATQLSEAGANIVHIALQMGWQSVETSKRYIKTSAEERQKIAEKLPPIGRSRR